MWTDGVCVLDDCRDQSVNVCQVLIDVMTASFSGEKHLSSFTNICIILCGFRMINDSSSLAHVIHLRKWRLMNANGHMVHEDASVCKWCKSFCVCSVWTPCPCDSLFMWDFNTIVHTFLWSVVKRRPWQHFSEGLVSSYISDVCVKQWE